MRFQIYIHDESNESDLIDTIANRLLPTKQEVILLYTGPRAEKAHRVRDEVSRLVTKSNHCLTAKEGPYDGATSFVSLVLKS